jgi:hypothetical protein
MPKCTSDIFFLQVPYTQGQAFTQDQWQAFDDWRMRREKLIRPASGLHEMFTRFDAED